MKRENEYSGEVNPKFNLWGIVVLLVVTLSVVVWFNPIFVTRSYTETTNVRLIDAQLVEFEWVAEYQSPLFPNNENIKRYERMIREVVTVRINESVREFIDGSEMYGANIDDMQHSIYKTMALYNIQPAIDTVMLIRLEYDEKFLNMIRIAREKKRVVEEANRLVEITRIAVENFEAEQQRITFETEIK